jgi:thiamine biosynthesis lipoprotein
VLSQRVYGIHGAQCTERAAVEIARLERLWSVFLPHSEISELARSAGSHPSAISSDTATVLLAAKRWRAWSEGAFDVMGAPLFALWREAAARGRVPESSQVSACLKLVNDQDLVLDALSDGTPQDLSAARRPMLETSAARAFLRRKGECVDLGGIAKGFAADRCRELYGQQGVRHAVLDLGGNAVVLGPRPDGSPWRVGIQSPWGAPGACIGYLEVEDCSVVTSGHYERYFEVAGRRYSHIVDPRTGHPVCNDLLSVTVVARSSMDADAVSTACSVLGLTRSLAMLADARDVEALFIDRSHAVHLTPGLVHRFFRGQPPVSGMGAA